MRTIQGVSVETCIVPNAKYRFFVACFAPEVDCAVISQVIATETSLDRAFIAPIAHILKSQQDSEFEVEFYSVGHVQIVFVPHLRRAACRLNMPADNVRSAWEWTDAHSGDNALWRFETGGMDTEEGP